MVAQEFAASNRLSHQIYCWLVLSLFLHKEAKLPEVRIPAM
jgi:hypothetical protein